MAMSYLTRKKPIALLLALLMVMAVLVLTPAIATAGPTYKWTNWTPAGAPMLLGGKVLNSKSAWACGNSSGGANYVLHWDGSTISVQNPPAPLTALESIDALDESHVWTVGQGGYIAFNNGGGWGPQPSGTVSNLFSVKALAPNNVWAVGGNGPVGTVCHYNGTNWAAMSLGTFTLHSVSAFDSTHIWAVGDGGTIYFSDGTNVVSQVSPTANNLCSVSALAPNDVWAVGFMGAAIHYDGTSWSNVPTGTGVNLLGVKALDSRNAILV